MGRGGVIDCMEAVEMVPDEHYARQEGADACAKPARPTRRRCPIRPRDLHNMIGASPAEPYFRHN